MENRLYPMRALLADLLQQGDGAAALREYETSMRHAPNRLCNWYGASRAAAMVGDGAKVVAYSRKLADLNRDGDATRLEMREVRQMAWLR